MIRQCS